MSDENPNAGNQYDAPNQEVVRGDPDDAPEVEPTPETDGDEGDSDSEDTEEVEPV